MLLGRIIRKIAGRGKVTAFVHLTSEERSIFGMTVVLHRRVREFREVQVFLRMPWGMELPLHTRDYILVCLPQGTFPDERKASISVYLNRQTIAGIRRCPEGTRLVLRFRTEPKGRGGVQVLPRRPVIYSKMTEYAPEKVSDL